MKVIIIKILRTLSGLVYKLLQKEVINQCINMDKKNVEKVFKIDKKVNEKLIDDKTIEISKEYDTLTFNNNITKIRMNSRIPESMRSCNEFIFNNNIKIKILVRIYIFMKRAINKLNK